MKIHREKSHLNYWSIFPDYKSSESFYNYIMVIINTSGTITIGNIKNAFRSSNNSLSSYRGLYGVSSNTSVQMSDFRGKGFLAFEDQTGGTANGTLGESALYSQNNWIRLTSATNAEFGKIYYYGRLGPRWEATFDIYAGGGTGADALWLFAYYSSLYTGSYSENASNNGYNVSFIEHLTDRIEIYSPSNTYITGYNTTLGDAVWRTAKVIFTETSPNNNNVKVYLNSSLLIDTNTSLGVDIDKMGNVYYGFAGRTGGANNNHYVRNISWTTT
jgi:hypothetical protein